MLAAGLTLLLAGGPLACAAQEAPARRAGFTEHPAMVRGAADAPVTVVEFSDYQ